MTQLARLRFPLVALFTLLAVLSMSARVSAKPTFHDNFTEVFPDEIVCGVPVTLELSINQVVTITDTSFTSSGRGSFVYTASDGRSVVYSFAGRNTGTLTDNRDGTVTFQETYNGIASFVSGGKGGPVMRMVGFVSILTTVDTLTSEVTSEVVMHGQFDQTDGNYLHCDAFLEALG